VSNIYCRSIVTSMAEVTYINKQCIVVVVGIKWLVPRGDILLSVPCTPLTLTPMSQAIRITHKDSFRVAGDKDDKDGEDFLERM
jgi:hypothetical protein